MPDGVVEQFVDDQSDWLDEKRGDHDVITLEADAITVRAPKLLLNYFVKRNLLPSPLRKERVRLSKHPHSLLDSVGIARRVIGAAQSNNAVDNRKRIPRTVIDLVEQPMLGCFEYLNFAELGDIDLGGEKIDQPALVVVDRA